MVVALPRVLAFAVRQQNPDRTEMEQDEREYHEDVRL